MFGAYSVCFSNVCRQTLNRSFIYEGFLSPSPAIYNDGFPSPYNTSRYIR